MLIFFQSEMVFALNHAATSTMDTINCGLREYVKLTDTFLIALRKKRRHSFHGLPKNKYFLKAAVA